jgi:endoglucanase Acf2
MTVQDSAGSVRLFRSNGWNAAQLQWDGDLMDGASAPTQRFSFERLDDHHFKVSYFLMKNGNWSRVDSSTCSKQ